VAGGPARHLRAKGPAHAIRSLTVTGGLPGLRRVHVRGGRPADAAAPGERSAGSGHVPGRRPARPVVQRHLAPAVASPRQPGPSPSPVLLALLRLPLPLRLAHRAHLAAALDLGVGGRLVPTGGQQLISQTLQRRRAPAGCGPTRAPAVGRVGLEPTTNGLKVPTRACRAVADGGPPSETRRPDGLRLLRRSPGNNECRHIRSRIAHATYDHAGEWADPDACAGI
jgi:hypothetical protein